MSALDAAEHALLTGPPADSIPALQLVIDRDTNAVDRRIAQWLIGVALGATGRYGEAWSVLDPLRHDDDVVAALAGATAASLHRQISEHEDARVLDVVALEVLTASPLVDRSPEALADVLIGLAADAVGVGDGDEAGRQLAAAQRVVANRRTGWRGKVRLEWVRAEIALLCGDSSAAFAAGQRAVAGARAAKAQRHVAKSLMFQGVAQVGVGDLEGASETLGMAATLAEALGVVPLVWPSNLVLARVLVDLDRPVEAQACEAKVAAALTVIRSHLPQEVGDRWLAREEVHKAHHHGALDG